MRILTVSLAIAATLVCGTTVEARRDDNKSSAKARFATESARTARSGAAWSRRKPLSQDSQAEIDRAASCDPAGRFDGYPAWARIAFACGDRR